MVHHHLEINKIKLRTSETHSKKYWIHAKMTKVHVTFFQSHESHHSYSVLEEIHKA